MKKLKVLYDFGPAYRKDKTGIPVFVEQICAELAVHQDIEFNVTANISKVIPSRARLLSRFVDKVLYYGLYLPIKLSLGKYDVYVESQYMYMPLIKVSRTKIVTIVYDIGLALFEDIQTPEHIANWRAKFPTSIKNSDSLVTISKSSLIDIQNYLILLGLQHKRVDYVYADTGALSSKTLTAPEGFFDQIDKYFLYLGTLEPRKNPMRVVRAFREFKVSTKSSAKLVFAGKKGWLYDDVFEFVSANHLEEEVIFTGFVSEVEKHYLLSNALAFVFLSVYEGFGIPPLEALKLGVPTLVSDIPVFRELFEESVAYADPMDHNAIAQAMSHILVSQPEIDPKIFNKFNWRESADQLVSIMKRCVST